MDPTSAERLRFLRSAWATLLVGAAAVVCLALPQFSDTLLFRHAELAAGEYWRLWTGHLVHFGGRHLIADLAVFLVAGTWLESFAPWTARGFLVLAPAAISALLYFADPHLTFYGGLSGIAVGLLVLLALVQLRRDRLAPRWIWVGVLVLVAVKVALEAFTNTPLVSDFGPDIKVSSLAHLGGILCALLAWPLARWESRPAQDTP
mgnify:CR=1 FL=1